jgi:tubulin--tyrosine ligase-like protein 12
MYVLLRLQPNVQDIERPILYEGRKFDLRYVLIIKSAEPLVCYVYNFFWIRLANEQFALNDFENYEKHFTVRVRTGIVS